MVKKYKIEDLKTGKLILIFVSYKQENQYYISSYYLWPARLGQSIQAENVEYNDLQCEHFIEDTEKVALEVAYEKIKEKYNVTGDMQQIVENS